MLLRALPFFNAISAWSGLLDGADKAGKDPKTRLQELVQGAGEPPPKYFIVERTGPDHAPVFTVEVRTQQAEPRQGQGNSRRAAEQAAAATMLAKLGAAGAKDDTI